MQWRNWWINPLKSMYRNVFNSISLSSPSPIFRDATTDMKAFAHGIDFTRTNKMGLADLRDACNKYLLPTVSCPYGCTEYLHKCESVPMDLVFQRYLSKVRLKICAESKNKISSCIGLRDDYIRDEGDEDQWLPSEEV